jgi:hypothetical protein
MMDKQTMIFSDNRVWRQSRTGVGKEDHKPWCLCMGRHEYARGAIVIYFAQ